MYVRAIMLAARFDGSALIKRSRDRLKDRAKSRVTGNNLRPTLLFNRRVVTFMEASCFA